MFMSVGQLETQMGVNKTIGRFFVDRKPPENNNYWKKRLLYVSFGNGYLFIPVYYDILHRIGAPFEALLNESHILFMEQIMHFSHLQETNDISKEEEQELIRSMLKDRVQSRVFYESLSRYLDQAVRMPLDLFGTNYPALNRADAFLYVLCDLPLNELQLRQALRYWYALLPSYLILDDIRDYADDKSSGEENVVIDLGEGRGAYEDAFAILRKNSEVMGEINPLMADLLLHQDEDLKIYIPANI
jgi:hypothetical protein